MVSIVARNTSNNNVLSLNVCIKNRQLGINTYVSMKTKIACKEWNAEMQLPKRFTDERPVKDLNGMSYSELGDKILEIKKELSAAEEFGTLTVDMARNIVIKIMNKSYIQEFDKKKEEEGAKVEAVRKTLKEFIREFIRECETGERLKRKSTRKIAASTIKNYKGTLAQIEEYEKASHHSIDFDDMTMDFYDGWRQFFIGKRYSPNTIGRHVKNLKIFLYAAKDLKLTTTTDFESARFSADREDVDNVYLTDERVQEMYDFRPTDEESLARLIGRAPANEREELRELTEKATSRQLLEEAKDVFVVGCLTGQRVSDYKRIHSGMIERLRDGRRYICIEQEKTGKEFFLPLDERVEKILAKYGGRLPKTYDQKLNERIKIVGRLLGWRENAGLTERHGLMEVRSRKKFYECIKTHTARRTFATNAYKNGISLASIMAVTGHSSEQMLRKYLKLDSKERAILAAEEFSRLRVKEAE